MANQEQKSRSKEEILFKLISIIIGNILIVLAFNGFFIPNKLLSGGVGGIALMTQYLTGIPSGIAVFVINIPIFLVGAKMVDREFVIYGFISMFIFSALLTFTAGIDRYINVDDILVAAAVGGALTGLGMGLMFRHRTNSGGLDIIAAILKKKYNMNMGTGLMVINSVIISLSSFLFGIRPAVYTLISMYISYNIVDKVQIGFNMKKNVFVVSDKSSEIADEIMKGFNRGVTLLEGMGGYKKENKKIIYCIVVSKEVAKLKRIVDDIDPAAFLIINDVVEVSGSTFKNVGI
ncbi:YitT family protein [Wansuia hejianensis]|uniref:YitT family protein n=1 Tax=Wansuia hejianensis TaxID=2763667 RepID=A0A926EVE4_9FIRM|nr:YitT family protein [Wansuia hejianensis]MBC8589631.1 YitT family protein [Wansuia hejianensis]